MVAGGSRVRATGRRMLHAVAPTVIDSVSEVPDLLNRVRRLRKDLTATRGEVRRLRGEVQGLREDVAEARRLHQRVAELTDIVADVLVAAADKDDPRIQRAIDEFAARSF